MAIKRRLTAIRLDKIAAVDRPCQQHATVAIIKRAPPGEVPPAIAKKTFQEALHAQLVSEKISDTFWHAFENQWAVREAFRTALTDEVAEGGDGSEAVNGFAAAMQEIASLAAEAAREAAKTDDATLEAAVESAVSKWLTQQEKPTMFKFTTKAALSAAISKFAVATATMQDAIDIRDSAAELKEEGLLPADFPLAKAAPAADPKVATLEREVAVLKMAPDVRKHFDGLAEDAQATFLAKSASAQAEEVAAANATDPVVFKCKDGLEIRKSDGAVVLAMAKRQDALAEENAILKGQVGKDSIKKRAAEFTNLPNAESIVKAADLMPEADRAPYLESMRAANKAAGGKFVRLGHAGGGTSIEKGADDPQARMDTIVKKFRDADPALSVAAATVKAAADPDYQEAYRDSVAHQLPSEAQ